jgi:hypothetical protein
MRLGDRHGSHDPSFRHLGEEALALLLGAEMEQRHDQSDAVLAGHQRHRLRHARDLLVRDADRGHAGAGTAVLLGQPQLQQAHVAEDRHQLLGKTVLAIDLGGDRRHLPGDHPAHAVAEGELLVGEIHGFRPVGVGEYLSS